MIRDLTKSALSFSWAVSLLGMKQVINMVGSERQSPRDVLAPITRVAVDQLDESMKNIYRSGDNLQARSVDMAFACFNPVAWVNPANWAGSARATESAGRSGGTEASQTSDCVTPTQKPQQVGIADVAIFFANPLNWVNPKAWNAAFGGKCSCGQPICRCGRATVAVGEAIRGAVGVATQSLARDGGTSGAQGRSAGHCCTAGSSGRGAWGPMPGNR